MQIDFSKGYLMMPRDLEERLFELNLVDFKVWHWLYFRASYRPGVITNRGELVTSIEDVTQNCSITPKRARHSLENLEKFGLISRKVANKGQTVCIAKYNEYNNPSSYVANKGQTNVNQMANKGQTKGKQRATLEEGNAVKKERKEVTDFASLEKPGETATPKPAVSAVVALPPPTPAFDRPFPLGDGDVEPDPMDTLTKTGKIKLTGPR